MAFPNLFVIPDSPLQVKMVTTAYDGMTVSYIRYKVFVFEQSISIDDEFDGTDSVATSFLFFLDHVPIGTLRYLKDANEVIHPGRIAILPPYRHQGYGKQMLRWLDQYLLQLYANVELSLHAQIHLVKFYEQLGYIQEGKPFLEANIEHLEMKKTLRRVTS